MSDCSTNANKPYDVARLRIEFQDGEVPWMYPLALNGRSIQGVYVDGERYERVRECEVVQGKKGSECSKCGKELPEDPYSDYEGNFCPTCGARIRKAVV